MSAHSNSPVLASAARIAAKTDLAFLAVSDTGKEVWIARNIKGQECKIVEENEGGAIIVLPRWLARKNGFEVLN